MAAPPTKFDAIVLGAGAAGLMCAAVAGQRGRRVLLLEHNAQPGRKILISGGGRCNFTNIHCGPGNFISENPHFAKSALAVYRPAHFLELVDTYRIPWHEKTLGQLFCDHSSRAILDMMLAECKRGAVEIRLNARGIKAERSTDGFHLASSSGEFTAGTLVVATGGLSIPKMGATGLAYDLARQFEMKVIAPRPALVPLVLGEAENGWNELTGVSTEVVACVNGGPRFREKMLFTHRGLSGPAVLQASSYWRVGQSIIVDFAPGLSAGQRLLDPLFEPKARRDLASFRKALHDVVPNRLAAHLSDAANPDGWSNAALEACERSLRRWEFHPAGTEGFEKAEVTAGGIDTNGLQSSTMESRSVSGLFFIGEAVDVTGHLGGFNFQWAWASGVAAGRAI